MRKGLHTSILFFVFAAAALAVNPTDVPKPGWNLFSKQQDVQLGREAAAQVERQYPLVRDSMLDSYVNNIGRRLVSTGLAGDYPFTFKVVNDQNINAFALPGGPTYVNVGLLKAADNEAQIAGVIAHELAHVALRHGTHQASKANLIQLPAMIAGGMLGNGSLLGSLAQLGIGLGANSVLLKFSRDAETEADNLGARMMARAGYNPIELARFFEKLERSGGSRGPQLLSDHPNPGNRMRYIQDEIRSLPQTNYRAENTGMYDEMKARLGSVRSQPQQQGYRSRSGETGSYERPSSRTRQYRSRFFEMSYPDNWEAFGDPEGGAVTLAPRSGLVSTGANGGTQIAYGVMVSYYSPRGDRVDLRNDTMDLIRELQRSNPGLQVGRQNTQRVNVDREDGMVTVLYSESPYQGETEHDTLLTVARPEGLFYAIFIAPASVAHEFNDTFNRMLRSINFR